MSGLSFEGVGKVVGGLIGGVGGGLSGAATSPYTYAGAMTGATIGATGGLVTGPGEVITVPGGAILGGIAGGSKGFVEGFAPGARTGWDTGGTAGKWLDDKISQMTGADEEADKKPSTGDDTKACQSCEIKRGKKRFDKNGKEIISEDRADHILSGDKTGGGHRPGTGKPGKTEFPSDWSDEKILDGVSDVAENGTIKGPAHRPGEYVKTGNVDGVDIDVVVKGDGAVRTGYPTGGVGVTKNPR
jgi:hypothetical protein